MSNHNKGKYLVIPYRYKGSNLIPEAVGEHCLTCLISMVLVLYYKMNPAKYIYVYT